MANFFRKDLNLVKKWWHRLLVVIFFWLFIYCLFSISKSFIFENGIHPVHKIQSSLKKRITSEVKSVKELSKEWEVLYRGKPDWIMMFIFWFAWEWKYQRLVKEIYKNQKTNEIFCSKKLYTQIDEVIKITWISQFYIKEINNFFEPIPIQTAIEYIKNNNIQCLLIGWFWGENKFLDPGWVAEMYQNDYYFYKKTGFSNFLTIFEIFTWIITIIIILTILFSILMLLYYKVILYVIYWSKKAKK